MAIEVKVPVLPESVEDASIATWHKKAGDTVRRDENLVDLETDKVVLEVPATADGVLKSIEADEGATVKSGELLATIEEGEVEKAAPAEKETDDETPAEAKQPEKSAAEPASKQDSGAKLSPAVRRVVEEENIDPSKVTGSGRGG
ncbi:MAG TPA: biotin/lipoyl-containing protein, partial [Xanthomonadales bacterium]|nr:biotin/lipoyl-containing protein [Xanthomonadales bacterium]